MGQLFGICGIIGVTNKPNGEVLMSSTFLTADEIFEIDGLDEDSLVDYMSPLPPEKRDLVSHIFSKNRSLRVLKVVADESQESNKRLARILEENGVKYK